MLARSERIPGKEFPRNATKIFAAPGLAVKAAPNGRRGNRFGFILSAKTEKSSVRRHELKRRIMARARKLPARGLDLLFIVLRPEELRVRGKIDGYLETLHHSLEP
jgi:ribonuclease P protein component